MNHTTIQRDSPRDIFKELIYSFKRQAEKAKEDKTPEEAEKISEAFNDGKSAIEEAIKTGYGTPLSEALIHIQELPLPNAKATVVNFIRSNKKSFENVRDKLIALGNEFTDIENHIFDNLTGKNLDKMLKDYQQSPTFEADDIDPQSEFMFF